MAMQQTSSISCRREPGSAPLLATNGSIQRRVSCVCTAVRRGVQNQIEIRNMSESMPADRGRHREGRSFRSLGGEHSTRMGDADVRLVRSSVIALVVTVAAFVVVAPATVAASSKTSPTAWANGVCSSVQTWLDSVNSTIKGLKGAGSLDAATTQAKTGVKTATDSLTSSIDALGTPSTGDGPKAKTAVNNLVTQLQSLSSSIQQTLASPGSTPVEVARLACSGGQRHRQSGQRGEEHRDDAQGLEAERPAQEGLQELGVVPEAQELDLTNPITPCACNERIHEWLKTLLFSTPWPS